MEEQKGFESWAVVEVMGHNTFAGFVTEQSIAGQSFVRVDVPEVPGNRYSEAVPAYTKFIGAASVYALTPCDESVARRVAESYRMRPLVAVSLEAPRQIEAASTSQCSDGHSSADDDVAF